MFDYKGSKSIFNKAELEKIVIDGDNITLSYKEGYEEDGKFIAVGADHIDFSDNDFLNKYNSYGDKEEFISGIINNIKNPPVKEVGEVVEGGN